MYQRDNRNLKALQPPSRMASGMRANTTHVIPKNGGLAVKNEGSANGTTSVYSTQREANDLGFAARCSLELDDASELRLDKIMRIPIQTGPRHCPRKGRSDQSKRRTVAISFAVVDGPLQRLPVPRSSEYPALRRDHWAVGRPSVRKFCLPSNRCGQPAGESSHVSCRP